MVSELSIVAFSDWRVQSFQRLIRLLKTLPTPDIIVYAGDDTNRFREYKNVLDIDFNIYKLSPKILKILQIIEKYSELNKLSEIIASDKIFKSFENEILKLSDLPVEKRNNELIYSRPIPKIEGVDNISFSIRDGRFSNMMGFWYPGKLEIEYITKIGKIVRSLYFRSDSPFKTSRISRKNAIELYHTEIEIEFGKLLQIVSLINAVMRSKKLKKLFLSEDELEREEYRYLLGELQETITSPSITEFQSYLKKYAKIIKSSDKSNNFLVLPNMRISNSIIKMEKFIRAKEEILVINWFEELSQLSRYGVFAILGNDCFPFDKHIIQGNNVFYIGEKSTHILEWELVGIDGTEEGEHAVGPIILSSNKIREKISKIQLENVIIISHTPPKGILDIGMRFGVDHIGSETLRKEIDRNKKVKLVICGHVHSHGGSHEKNEHYTVVNASSHDSPGSIGNVAFIRVSDEVAVEWYDTKPELEKIDGLGHWMVNNFESNGVFTREQFNNLTVEDVMRIGDLSKIRANNLIEKVRISGLERGEWSGEMKVPPLVNTIFLDIETDTMSNRVWLIGVLLDGKVEQMVARNWEEEEEILLKFHNYLKRHPALPVFFYSATHFDYRVIKNAAIRLKLNNLLQSMKNRAWVDLALIIKKVYKTGYSMGLKRMCDYLGYELSHIEYNGLRLAQQYEAMVRNIRLDKKFMQIAKEYNLDDIKSLPFIINALANDEPLRVIVEERYIHKPGSLIIALDQMNILRINEKEDISKSSISINCSYKTFEDVYFGIICSGTTIPAIHYNKNSVRLTWKGSTGFSALNEVLEGIKY